MAYCRLFNGISVMFTGIVQDFCSVVSVQAQTKLRQLLVDLGGLADGLQLGASVAINGTCLTATQIQGAVVTFDVIQETLDHTNLGGLKAGDNVNVERSLRFGDEIGGHIVSGHVSDKVVVERLEAEGNERVVHFKVTGPWMKYLHHKGFVSLDGASITIASTDPEHSTFSVALIPETIARTTLGRVTPGDWVNLEIDQQTQAVVDTVDRLAASPEWLQRLAEGLKQQG
mgnify:CR=1 FL=1|tara:strand:+ start:329 stop:1015 length:687 start_codon:yes stop_codon:yes gene_type:complete